MTLKQYKIGLDPALVKELDALLPEFQKRTGLGGAQRRDQVGAAIRAFIGTMTKPPGPARAQCEPHDGPSAGPPVGQVPGPSGGLRAPARAPGFAAAVADNSKQQKQIAYTERDCEIMARRYNPDTLRRVFEAIGATDTAAQNLRIVEWQNIDGGRVKAAMARLLDAVAAGKATNPPGLLKHLINTMTAGEVLEALPGGNGKPKPRDTTIPEGYPDDIYNGRAWRWSSKAGANGGWYPVDARGFVDVGAQYWPWVEGMRKGK